MQPQRFHRPKPADKPSFPLQYDSPAPPPPSSSRGRRDDPPPRSRYPNSVPALQGSTSVYSQPSRDDRSNQTYSSDPHAGSTLDPDRQTSVTSAVERPYTAASSQVSSRVERASALTETIEKLKLTSFYVRPGYGNKGKNLTVLANFFQVRAKDGKAKII